MLRYYLTQGSHIKGGREREGAGGSGREREGAGGSGREREGGREGGSERARERERERDINNMLVLIHMN